MAHVKYDGPFDIRVVTAEDLKQFGVEGFSDTDFHRNEVVEVNKKVAEALIENFGFSSAIKEKAIKADEESVADTGSAQENVGTPGAPSTTTTPKKSTSRASTP